MLIWIHVFKNGRSCNFAGSYFINYEFHHPLILEIARYRQKPFHVFLSQKITASLILDHRQEAVIPSSYPNRVALETSTRTQEKLIIICLQGAPAEMLLLDVTLGLMRSLVRLTFGPISAKNIIILVPPTTTTAKRVVCNKKLFSCGLLLSFSTFPRLFRARILSPYRRNYPLGVSSTAILLARKKEGPLVFPVLLPLATTRPKSGKRRPRWSVFWRVGYKLFSSDLLILVFPAQHVHTVTTHSQNKIGSKLNFSFSLSVFFPGTKP